MPQEEGNSFVRQNFKDALSQLADRALHVLVPQVHLGGPALGGDHPVAGRKRGVPCVVFSSFSIQFSAKQVEQGQSAGGLWGQQAADQPEVGDACLGAVTGELRLER